MPLPVRFRNYEELTARQKEARFHDYHHVNLNAKDLKPLLRDKFRPFLKTSGFRRVSDSLSVRAVEPHYVHCLRLTFNSVYPGRFFVRAGIALDILPRSDGSAFSPSQMCLDTDCLFTRNVTLPNGNPEFDNGSNLEEAGETINYLISCCGNFDRDYFGQFVHFPEPLDQLGVDFVGRLAASIRAGSPSKFGMCGATIGLFTFRLALVHRLLGNRASSRELLEYGLANYELRALRSKYERLLRETGGC